MVLAETAGAATGGLEFLWQQRGPFFSGLLGTVELSVVAGILATIIGLIVAAMRVSPIPALRVAGTAWSGFFRNTPLTLVFLATSVVLPLVGIRFAWADAIGVDTFFIFAVIALSTYTSCFVADAIRSGFNAVPVGQAEAARAVGMTFGQTLRLVVLPQALRSVLPPLASMYIAMIKNSAIAVGVGVTEMGFQMKKLQNDYSSSIWAIFVFFAIAYMVLVAIVALVTAILERRVRVA